MSVKRGGELPEDITYRKRTMFTNEMPTKQEPSAIELKGTVIRIGSWTYGSYGMQAETTIFTLIMDDGQFHEFRFGSIGTDAEWQIKRVWSLSTAGDSVEVFFHQSGRDKYLSNFKNLSIGHLVK